MARQLWRYLHVFFCLSSDGFLQIMCLASFNFNLNRVDAESIISEQLSILSAFEFSLLTMCTKT